MKLRFQLLDGTRGTALPECCQLPDGYECQVTSGRTCCGSCGGRLRRVRSSTHRPVGLMLGQPRVHLIQQQCTVCGQADPLEVYDRLVPRAGNYAYDLIVEVGLARLRDYRQDEEIRSHLVQRWGLSLPLSAIGLLAHSFLDGLAAVHQAHAPALARRLAEEGGYCMHVDGTCEAGTEVLFAALAEPRGWTLDAAKMPTENTREIRQLMQRAVQRFGAPLAVVRDLSGNIERAKQEAIPQARDLICHYHFLENVGEQLCQKSHARLESALRRLKVRSALRSIRKDLIRWTRKAVGLSRAQIRQLLSDPQAVAELDAAALRRFVAYVLLRWLDDYQADLQGEYFPFDLPSLAFYRRGRQLEEMLRGIVTSAKFPQRELSTLKTIAGHLAPLREDAEVVAVACRLEKSSLLFEELRRVLRLSRDPRAGLLRGRGEPEDSAITAQMPSRLASWRERLQQRHEREQDADNRVDQAMVLKYLKKYASQLVGHVIELPGQSTPLVASRTNNPAEHRFKTLKQEVRRKVGLKKLTRQVQAMRAEALLVPNLWDAEYVRIVLDGSLSNLATELSQHWELSQSIRKERLARRPEAPIPITKKELRAPQLLETVRETVNKIAETVSEKTNAA